MNFELDSEASDEELATLEKLTERYCVVFQTLAKPPEARRFAQLAPLLYFLK